MTVQDGFHVYLENGLISRRDCLYKISLKAQKHGAGTPNYNSISIMELHE